MQPDARPDIALDSEPNETRGKIIDAAVEVFADKGYARSTTRAIAAAAHVNEVTLFRHFGNKLNLLAEVIHHYSIVPGLQNLLNTQMTGDYRQNLMNLAGLFFRQAVRQRSMVRLTMCEAHQIPELGEVFARNSQQSSELLTEYFRRQIEDGMVRRELQPDWLGRAFFGMVIAHGMGLRRFKDGQIVHETPPDSAIEQFVDIFARGTESS
jgi:AcrR family transcriptional regulator